MDKYFASLLWEAQKRFPDAVRVNICITAHGVTVTPEYRGALEGYAMRTINGQWCGVREGTDHD